MDTNFNDNSDEQPLDPNLKEYVVRPNKSALKRDHHKVQKLALDLINLPQTKMEKLIIDESIQHLIILGKRLKGGALKRQIKHIANKLLSIESEQLMALMQDDEEKENKLNLHFQRLERMRDKLLLNKNEYLNDLLQQYTQLDRQQ